ncbi:ANTH-domain-containing protein [Laetiporus sulphureus 93-53]|uniref:ANTH-domain-containing protein n=1 Tax=Laetiporus sulphureus 93-53 TaxID=1314785 RepID=A0A165EP85_9APHY|nr:ANTH-domain-containing protein [Laetiporus sulphureus 93-53]KZT07476.1 ANTH-domain-containing protein [Laetiporus sulphureus 93-53]
MSSYEKAVKGACKPKPNPPKAKYLDPILAATWSEDGAVHDVCRALVPRFREPNVLVVFKALIVLHMMIRNGSTDNVLSYLSSSDVLRLKNVSAGSWEGYNAPQNIQHYANYLDIRIRAYAQLKHDAIRVQSENNRDMRNSAAIEEMGSSSYRSRSAMRDLDYGGMQRSKTISGRKLRVMTVEKGLLRETRVVQKMIDALVECRFYLDDLDNELNITALRMLVKDLLILFQACNEGVINVLEHYFEMFKSDAQEALKLYRHFCEQTEHVVEYLSVAKKLQNILNVPVPNLRHAPVSLAGALEEYLNDPNFEQNRIEYKANKEAADKPGSRAIPVPQAKIEEKAPETKPSTSTETPAEASKAANSQAMIDFFSAIEGEQQTMFNPQTNSPSGAYFQQHAAHNPFAQHQVQMMTGAPFAPQQMQMQPQPTGFIMAQHTATNPFGMQMQQQQQPAPFMQPQQTGFLQPQATGSNPFRQTMMLPQMTGMAAFNMGMGQQQQPQQPINTNPFPTQSTGMQALQTGANMPSFSAFGSMHGSSQMAAPIAQQPNGYAANAGPARPMSAPLTSHPSTSSTSSGPPPAQPIKTHQTGSRNPFGTPVVAPPPMPKPPTLFELAMGAAQNSQQNGMQGGWQQQQQQQQQISPGGTSGFSSQFGTHPTGSAMASVASSFTFNKLGEPNDNPSAMSPLNPQPTSLPSSTTGSTFSNSLFSSLSSQPTGMTNNTSLGSPTMGTSALQPQKTGGLSGLRPFKPSSSFGAALLESLPPIPSAPSTPQPQFSSPTSNGAAATSGLMFGGGLNGLNTQQTGFGGLNSQPTGAFSTQLPNSFNSQSTGAFGSQQNSALTRQPTGALGNLGQSTVGVGLRPQMTGSAGAANPFRATMFANSTGMTGGPFGAGAGFTNQPPPPLPTSQSNPGLGNSPFGMNGSAPGMPSFAAGQFGTGQNLPNMQQQYQSGPLI